MRTKKNARIITKDEYGNENGFLIPIFNIHDHFHLEGDEPKQVYLTAVRSGMIKGPHLHFLRKGCFTCIKGNIRVVTKENGKYVEYFSGEDFDYLSIIIEKGIPAALQNISNDDAFVLNMPSPAWTPEMNDEQTADFSDFDFNRI